MRGVPWVTQQLRTLPSITFLPALHHGKSEPLDAMANANSIQGRKVFLETLLPRTWQTSPHGLTSIAQQLLVNGRHRFTSSMPRTILPLAAMWTTLVIAVAQAAPFLQLQTTLSVLVTADSALPILPKLLSS